LIKLLKIPLLLCIFAILVTFILNYLDIITAITRDSISYAVLISIINFLVFVILTEYSYKKSNKLFLLYNVGGMGVRIFLMLLLVFITIKFLKVDEFEYIFTFFLLYILFLVCEINIIIRKVEKPKKDSKEIENVVQ